VSVHPVERKLAAIFAADIAGYSRLMARDEVGTLAQLKACRVIIDELIASHRGRIFNTAGDSVVADFASAVDAVQCAVAVQAALATENAGGSADEPMQFRVGVHVGDVMVDGENLLGDGVNIAARLESLAEPGAICISAAARDHIGNKLPLGFDDLGEQEVKNIAQAIRVYRVQVEKPAAQPAAALPLPDKPSIAVLPFQNMSGDPEQDYFVDGMVEEIITALSKVRWFFVIARNSSFTYKGRAVNVKQIGRELGVRYVLEGSVRKGGGRVRITAQLIEAETGAHLWADRFDRDLADIFAVQDDVTERVVTAIEPNLRQAEIARSKRTRPENLAAYDLYLRALPHFYGLWRDRAGWAEALSLLRQALAVDPEYAAAAALAAVCIQFGVLGGWVASAEEAAWFARTAVRLDQDDPEALAICAYITAIHERQFEEAVELAERATALNPNSASCFTFSGWAHLYAGRAETALEHFERALRLNPVDPLSFTMLGGIANAHIQLEQSEAAIVAATRATRRGPDVPGPWRNLAAALAQAGRYEEARDAGHRMLEIDPKFTLSNWGRRIGWNESGKAKMLNLWRLAGLPEE
jgi:adenylate cyclase